MQCVYCGLQDSTVLADIVVFSSSHVQVQSQTLYVSLNSMHWGCFLHRESVEFKEHLKRKNGFCFLLLSAYLDT